MMVAPSLTSSSAASHVSRILLSIRIIRRRLVCLAAWVNGVPTTSLTVVLNQTRSEICCEARSFAPRFRFEKKRSRGRRAERKLGETAVTARPLPRAVEYQRTNCFRRNGPISLRSDHRATPGFQASTSSRLPYRDEVGECCRSTTVRAVFRRHATRSGTPDPERRVQSRHSLCAARTPSTLRPWRCAWRIGPVGF